MESGGPKRVILDDFTITVSPTDTALTIVQARNIVDFAEELVEAFFQQYDWGDSTFFQYMGFTNIGSVSFYDQSYSVILVKGGIVSFDGSSESIPTNVEIQKMIQDQLDPGLLMVLQASDDFSFVKETIYDIELEPTAAPSDPVVPDTAAPTVSPTKEPTVSPTKGPTVSPTEEPTVSPTKVPTVSPTKAPVESPTKVPTVSPTKAPVESPTKVPTVSPTKAPVESPTKSSEVLSTVEPTQSVSTVSPTVVPTMSAPSPGLVSVPKVSVPVDNTNDGSSASQMPMIVALVAALLLVSSLAVLLVYKRRRKAAWRQNANHHHPPPPDLEQGFSKQDARSEAGSSRLGRLLTAAGVRVSNLDTMNDSTATPPQTSSEESQDDFSECGGVSVEPQIVPINTEDYVLDTVDVETKASSGLDLESGIAELVQIISQESKVAKEEPPGVVVEEGVLFVQSNSESPHDVCNIEAVDRDVRVEPAIVPESKGVDRVVGGDKAHESFFHGHEEFDTNALAALEFCDSRATEEEVAASVVEENDIQSEADGSVDGVYEDAVSFIDWDADDTNESEIVEDAGKQLLEIEEQHNLCSTPVVVQGGANTDEQELGSVVNKEDVHVSSSDIDNESIGSIKVDLDTDENALVPTTQLEQENTVDRFDTNVDPELTAELQAPTHDADLPAEPEESKISSTTGAEQSNEIQGPLQEFSSQGEATPRHFSPYTRWSDVSSAQSPQPSLSDDDQLTFQPDESWDFNDNDEEESEALDDPFQTPSTLQSNDTKPLLYALETHAASDETVESDVPSSTAQESESDATPLSDPFLNPNTAPSHDEKPLLTRVLSTYNLHNVTTSDSEKRRRSHSAPPATKRRTNHFC